MLISIVVPSYNVESFVEECLDSCVNQSLNKDEYEIVVINDGSKDRTLEVVNDYITKRQTTNIKVYSQENAGLSATRNRGVQLAQGDYVWFVDSDDWIADNVLTEIADLIVEHHQPEVVVLDSILRKGGVDQVIKRPLSQAEGDGKYIYDNSYIFPYSGAPFYLYKRSFLMENRLSFKEGIYFEDCLFTPMVMSLAQRCLYYSKPAYIYRLRENSITTSSISEKKLHDMKTVADELVARYNGSEARYMDVLKDAACRNYEVLFRYYILKSDSAMQKKFLRLLNEEKRWKSMLVGTRLKHKIYYCLMRGYALFRS